MRAVEQEGQGLCPWDPGKGGAFAIRSLGFSGRCAAGGAQRRGNRAGEWSWQGGDGGFHPDGSAACEPDSVRAEIPRSPVISFIYN